MKLINDTLKDENGNYSRKSLTTLVSFVNAILLGWYISANNDVNEYAVQVCFGFLFLGGGALTLTLAEKFFEWHKFKNKKNEAKN